MISILIAITIFCVLAWLISYVTSLPGVPPPVRVIAYVVLAVVAIVWLLQMLPGGLHVGRLD